jgi:hypothetical protein
MTRGELPVPATPATALSTLVADLARRSLDRFANWDELAAVLALALGTRLPVMLLAVHGNEVGLSATIWTDPKNGNLSVDVTRIEGVFSVADSLLASELPHDDLYTKDAFEDSDYESGARAILRDLVKMTGVSPAAWRVAPVAGPWPSWCLALPDALPIAASLLGSAGGTQVKIAGFPPLGGQVRLVTRSAGLLGGVLALEITDLPKADLRRVLPRAWSEDPLGKPGTFVRKISGRGPAEAIQELAAPLAAVLNGMVLVDPGVGDRPLYVAWSGPRRADRTQS